MVKSRNGCLNRTNLQKTVFFYHQIRGFPVKCSSFHPGYSKSLVDGYEISWPDLGTRGLLNLDSGQDLEDKVQARVLHGISNPLSWWSVGWLVMVMVMVMMIMTIIIIKKQTMTIMMLTATMAQRPSCPLSPLSPRNSASNTARRGGVVNCELSRDWRFQHLPIPC